MNRSLSAACLLALAAPAATHAAVTGFVYEDRDGNGARDGGEPGIAGVAVSDGTNVVVTGADGAYALPTQGDAVIFISKPATHALPRGENGMPLFYHVHRPAGSPPLRYGGIAPTGPLPASLDFALLPQQPRQQFRAFLLADPQPRDARELDYVRRDIISEVASDGAVDVGIILGDILFDDLDMFRPWSQAASLVGFPVFHVIGNHDLDFDAVSDLHSGDTYTSHFGPLNYSFREGNVHFVVLDNIRWNGAQANNYAEAFDQPQMDWLAKDIALVPEDHLVVVCTHGPLWFADGGSKVYAENLRLLLDVLEDRRAVYAVSGHTHYTSHRFLGPEDGWNGAGTFHAHNIATGSGSWWSGPTDARTIPVADQRDGTPNGYVVVDFDGASYTPRYRAAGHDRDHQMRIYAPGAGLQPADRDGVLLVNVFDGIPDATVTVSINDGEPIPMSFAPQRDPLAMMYYGSFAEAGKTWVNPVNSHHIWEAPVELRRGRTHKVAVRYEDRLGRVFTRVEVLLHR